MKNLLISIVLGALTLWTVDRVFFSNDMSVDEQGSPRSINLREYPPKFEATITPNQSYLETTDSLEIKPYSLSLDEMGFISNGNQNSGTFGPATKILFFGGSTTESLFVPEDMRFVSQLERNLRERTGEHFVTLNGGRSGNHSMHSWLNLAAKGIPVEADYAVLMNNVNDLSLLRKTGSYWLAPPGRSVVVDNKDKIAFYALAKGLKDLLAPNLYRYLRPRLVPDGQDEFANYRGTTFEIEQYAPLYESSLRTFIGISRAWGIEPILMTQFSRFRASDTLFQRNYESVDPKGYIKFAEEFRAMNEIVRAVAKSEECSLIDLESKVPPTSEYIYDAIHLNERGSTLVADVLTDFFMEKNARN